MATVLTSLHHVQRLLRRLPVGDAASVLHLNELPSNVQARLPVVVQQHRQRLRTRREPRRPDGEDGVDVDGGYARLLTMRPPALTVSDAALFALFRTAQKERRAQRRRWAQHRLQQTQSLPSSPALSSDPLAYLQDLEEACLLLPDTRNARVSLGVAAVAPQRALAQRPSSAMDAVHVSLASSCTDHRVDYAAVPLYYVLGVPTRLLEEERGGSPHGNVDLARWLVVDTATGQILLRRQPRGGTADAAVFLAQTYSFEPRRAYAAALHATAASPAGTAPLYTLFYLQLARHEAAAATAVSPENAGTTYPASFVSYTTEVRTTRELAVRAAAASTSTSASASYDDGGSAGKGGAADATPLFMSLAGKRLRFAAPSPSLSGTTSRGVPSEGAESHLWTTQIVSRQHGMPSPPARFPAAGVFAAGTEGSAAAADAGRQREASAQSSLHAAVTQSFHDWQAMVSATGAAGVVEDAGAETDATLHTPRELAAEAAAVSHRRTSVAATSAAAGGAGHHRTGAAATTAAAAHDAPSLLERQLDAEAPARGPCEWQRGLRLRRVSIAVARPLLPRRPPALPALELRARSALDASSMQPSSLWSDVRGRHVSEAPLASALWEALYMGPTPPLPSVDGGAGSASSHGGVDVLPLGLDRLARARERVLVPFLVHQPRRVLPSSSVAAPSARPSHETPVEGTEDAGRSLPRHGTLDAAVGAPVYPLLWRLAELEELCGWHRHAAVFERVFGTFAGLLVREMYVTVGQRSPALPVAATAAAAAPPDPRASPPQSPLVLFASVAYVLRVLHPALWAFAARTCTRLASGLCVYRPLPHDPYSPAAARAAEGGEVANGDAAEVALAVAVHHRRLRTWLRCLQAVAPTRLRAWLATAHSCSTIKTNAAAAVAEVSTVPASCLLFFAGAVFTSSVEVNGVEAGTDAAAAVSAAALSEEALSCAVDRLLGLTPSCIHVVPLMDFVVWGATASDFSAAAVRCHAERAASCRAALDETVDGVALVRYCMRFPRQLCCEGGDGRTVAVLHSGG